MASPTINHSKQLDAEPTVRSSANQSRKRRRLTIVILTAATCAVGYDLWRSAGSELKTEVEQAGGRHIAYRPNSLIQSWLRQLNGTPSTTHIIRFAPGRINDKWLERNQPRLDDLKNLQLTIKSPNVSDDGVAHLATAQGLTSLDASRTTLTDQSTKTLSQLPSLLSLVLSDTQISDASIANFNQMPALNSLDVSGTDITDSGIAQLRAKLLGVGLDSRQLTPKSIGAPILQARLNYLTLYDADAQSIDLLIKVPVGLYITIQGERVNSKSMVALESLIEAGSFRNLTLLDTQLNDDEISKLKQLKTGINVQTMTTLELDRLINRSTPVSNSDLW